MAIILVTMYVVWCGLVYFLQDRLLFPGPFNAFKPPAGAERLAYALGEGEVFAYLTFPRVAESGGAACPLVVLFHGNGESITRLEDLRRGYLARGYAVLTPEYRGYAGAAGTASEAGIIEDAIGFIDEVGKRPDIDAGHVLYHGRSLGGAVAAQVALRRPPVALILQSTFTSITGMSWSFGVPPFLVKNPLHTDRALASLAIPVLLLHGTSDTIVPVRHSRTLATIGQDRTLVELPGGHNNFPVDPAPFWAAIDGWLQSHGR